MAAYKEFIHHNNDKISDRWMTRGENEFGCLFKGFKPNEVDGPDVIKWIPKTSVPSNKTVVYPRYTTVIRPKKMKNVGIQTAALLATLLIFFYGDPARNK